MGNDRTCNTLYEANTILVEAVEAIIHDQNKVNKQKVIFLKWKHFVILRLWIQKVKLNYTGLTLLSWNIHEKNTTDDGYT